MKIVYTIILGLALVVLLRAIFYFFNLANRNRKQHYYFVRIYPWLEIIVWIAYSFWTVQYFLAGKNIYPFVSTAMIIIVMGIFSWFVVRDFLAGAVIKSDLAIKPGMTLESENISGTVISLGYLSMEVRNQEGELVKIPYLRLSNQMIIRKTEKSQGKSHTIKLLVPQHHGIQNIGKQLTKRLLQMPWVIATSDINIEMHPKDEFYEAEINFHSIKEEMFTKSEELIRSFVKESLGRN